jgi:hypothetical protein
MLGSWFRFRLRTIFLTIGGLAAGAVGISFSDWLLDHGLEMLSNVVDAPAYLLAKCIAARLASAVTSDAWLSVLIYFWVREYGLSSVFALYMFLASERPKLSTIVGIVAFHALCVCVLILVG